MIGSKLRHAALLRACPELFDPVRRVLEVGDGPQSIVRGVDRAVVAVARTFGGALDAQIAPVCATVTQLPFGAGAFDDVVCADALHRIGRADRARALAELVRVAAKRVIVCVPAGAFATSADAAYEQHLTRAGRPLSAALRESQEHGIPAFADLLALLVATGRRFTVAYNESVTTHFAARFVDEHPFLDRYLAAHDRKFPAEAPLRDADGDLPYSFLIVIETDAARALPSSALADTTNDAHRRPRTLEIFAATHRRDRMPAIPGIEWIFAGANGRDLGADAPARRDDRGDHISARNPGYSEMTAIYWLWRNVAGLDAVGFCQYRRYFDFRPGPAAAQRETYLRAPEDVLAYQAHFVDLAAIAAHLDDGAIVVARPMQLAVWNPEQYMIGHIGEHYLAMINYVLDAHPDYTPQVLAQANDRTLYGCNMFVMPWRDFDRLCAFWFDCLFGIEKTLAVTRTGYHGRVYAFLSERIFDLHMRKLADAGLRLAGYPIFCLEDTAFAPAG